HRHARLSRGLPREGRARPAANAGRSPPARRGRSPHPGGFRRRAVGFNASFATTKGGREAALRVLWPDLSSRPRGLPQTPYANVSGDPLPVWIHVIGGDPHTDSRSAWPKPYRACVPPTRSL